MHNRQEISIIPSKDFGFHLIFNYAGAKHYILFNLLLCTKTYIHKFYHRFYQPG